MCSRAGDVQLCRHLVRLPVHSRLFLLAKAELQHRFYNLRVLSVALYLFGFLKGCTTLPALHTTLFFLLFFCICLPCYGRQSSVRRTEKHVSTVLVARRCICIPHMESVNQEPQIVVGYLMHWDNGAQHRSSYSSEKRMYLQHRQ